MKKQIKIKTVKEKNQKMHYVNSVWEVLKEGYEKVQGGLHYASKEELMQKTDMWKVICYRGEVIAVTVYRAKKGLKLVAMSAGRRFRELAVKLLGRVVQRDLKQCWMELSEAAEKFVMKLGGGRYILPDYIARTVLEKEVQPAGDGVHYIREIMGIQKEKVLLGTVKL
jgi:hypothetical protein